MFFGVHMLRTEHIARNTDKEKKSERNRVVNTDTEHQKKKKVEKKKKMVSFETASSLLCFNFIFFLSFFQDLFV